MELRRILLDGAVGRGDARRRRPRRARRASRRVDAAVHLPPVEPDQDPLLPPQPRLAACASSRSQLPARADVLPQAGVRAQRARRRGRAPVELPVAQLRGRGRHRDRARDPQRHARRGRRPHRRLHHRQRLRAPRLPRHRRRLDAPGQGRRHAVPARPGARHRLGPSTHKSMQHAASTASSRPGRLHRRDGLGHALPRRRPRPAHHARAGRRHPLGHARRVAARSSRATSSPSRSRASAR